MGVQKIKPSNMAWGWVMEQQRASLMESVHASMNAAREQVGRSSEIVARSHELIDRTRQSLARANQIRQTLVSATYNPIIVVPRETTEQQ